MVSKEKRREQHRLARVLRRKRHVDRGDCLECGRSREGTTRLCNSCRATYNAATRRRAARKYMGPLVGPRWVAREQPMPIAPTIATPGTTEKMDIMAERASRDEPLFHIDDA